LRASIVRRRRYDTDTGITGSGFIKGGRIETIDTIILRSESQEA
jgi:hypothetical protein